VPDPTPLQLFATCAPGLELLLEAELTALGAAAPRAARGGVAFEGDGAAALRANLQLGTASQVLIHCGGFHCRSLGELVRKTSQLPWAQWLRPGEPLAIKAQAKRSRLFHTGAIAERVHEGIGVALGQAPPPGTAPSAADTPATRADDAPAAAASDPEAIAPTVIVRFYDDECTLHLDTSGEPLHRRGWRLATAKAPLRPDLARALVLASGYDPEHPFLDPFCGSGTIAIEAATLARGLAPGLGRTFAWSRTALGDPDLERALRDELRTAARDPGHTPAPIAASDRDRGAVAAAVSNAERAGVAEDIAIECRPFSDANWLRGEPRAERGTIATNPPFGLRVKGGSALPNLYQSLGGKVLRLGPGWRTAILTHDHRLARRTGIPLRTAFVSPSGGKKVTGMVGVPAAESPRAASPTDE